MAPTVVRTGMALCRQPNDVIDANAGVGVDAFALSDDPARSAVLVLSRHEVAFTLPAAATRM